MPRISPRACGRRGYQRKAGVQVEKAMQFQPALSISFIRSRFVSTHKTTLKFLLDSLRKAGVAE